MKISLNKNTFYRNFGDIGYLFNQSNLVETILDEIGSIFLSNISRYPTSIREVSKKIHAQFQETDILTIENDLIEFISSLEQNSYFDFHGEPLKFKNEAGSDDSHTATSETSYILKKYFQKKPTPLFAHLEVTSACNLKCVHCYWPNHNVNHLPTNDALRVLDELRAMKCLHLTLSGGEALLHPDILSIIRYARELDFSVTLMTNGVKLDYQHLKELKKANLSAVQLSLYSMNESVHDSITRVPGSYAKTISAINQLLELDIPIKIACPVMKQNYDSFISVSEHYIPLGVFVDHDMEIIPKTDFSRDNIDECRLSENELYIAAEKIHNISAISKSEKNINIEKPKNTRAPDDPVCGAGIQMLSISNTGDVYPCPTFKYKIGNIYKSSLSDIWHSKEIFPIRSLTMSDYRKCQACKWGEYCSICPANFYIESGGNYRTPQDFFCKVTEATARANRKP